MQIKQTFNEFINDHPNGKISKDEFGATMKKVYLGWCRYYVDNNYTLYRFFSHPNVMFQVIPDSDGDKMKEHIFRVFDKNGDGSIDFSEFMVSKRSR